MYVKKYEAESLDEALKSVKKDLGPDAIILKTVTNKGLKGAFRKKVEVTAAISENNYVNKINTDKVFSEDQKENFYNAPAENIKKQINNYNEYGNIALNKPVKKVDDNMFQAGLDDFLSDNDTESPSPKPVVTKKEETSPINDYKGKYVFEPPENYTEESVKTESFQSPSEKTFQSEKLEEGFRHQNIEIRNCQNQIKELEKMILDLKSNQQGQRQVIENNPLGNLRKTLLSLGVCQEFTANIVKKAQFELSNEELLDSECLLDFSLREMDQMIKIKMPNFSITDEEKKPTITVLISETSSGQSSIFYKIGSMKKTSTLITFGQKERSKDHQFTQKMFDLKVLHAKNTAELVSACRKSIEANHQVFIDFNNSKNDIDETRKIIDGLKRGFDDVEVFICLSAIHSENYNEKHLRKYKNISHGVIFSHLDLCLSYSELINVHYKHNELPLIFFGTGKLIPDDIETANSERLLAGLLDIE